MRLTFPWVQQDRANVMKWVLIDSEARRRLDHWATEWAPLMVGQLRVQQLRYPDNQRLADVIREVLTTSAEARRWWDMPRIKFHPDGDRRSLYLPGQAEPHVVQIVAVEPLRAPGSQLIMLVPADPVKLPPAR